MYIAATLCVCVAYSPFVLYESQESSCDAVYDVNLGAREQFCLPENLAGQAW